MFYKLVNKLFTVGRLCFGRFWAYFDIFLIFTRLQCPHCALITNKKSKQNNLQNQLDLIYRTYLVSKQRLLLLEQLIDINLGDMALSKENSA